jgi:hypothetical protein
MEQEDKESLFNGIKNKENYSFQGLYLFVLDYFSVLCYKFFKQLDGFSVDSS